MNKSLNGFVSTGDMILYKTKVIGALKSRLNQGFCTYV